MAQLGAIHAIAAHFSMRRDPAVITMPTGSGKTAVLIAAAFVLRAKRILIVAPGRLVREQIADEVEKLATLTVRPKCPHRQRQQAWPRPDRQEHAVPLVAGFKKAQGRLLVDRG